MEVLGATASVAGLLSLVAQSIDGIVRLRGFIKDVKRAPATLEIFLENVDAFQESLIQIQDLLSQVPREANLDLLALEWQLDACFCNIRQWLHEAQKYDISSLSGVRAFFKQLRVAANEDGFREFHSQIARHQRGLQISLSVLGPSLSILGLARFESLNAKVETIQKNQSRRNSGTSQTLRTVVTQDILADNLSNQNSSLTSFMESNVRSPLAEQLERVESFTGMSVAYSKQSSDEFKSLSDAVTCLGSQVSQLRGMITSGLATTEEEEDGDFKYSCNTMVGIEEAFMDDKCVYCELDFSSITDWEHRGMHLIKNHMFGDCNFQANSYQPERFVKHLCVKHSAVSNCDTQRFLYSKRRIQHLNRREPFYDSMSSNMAPENLSDDGNSENTPSITQHEKSVLHHLKQMRKCDLEDGSDTMCEDILASYWNFHWRLNCLMERQNIKRRMSQYSPGLIVHNIFARRKKSPRKLSWRMGKYYRYASSVCEPVTRGWRAGSCHSSNLESMLDSLIENAALEVEVDDASMTLLESRKRCRKLPELAVPRQDHKVDCWVLQILAESETAETIIPASCGMVSPDESSVYI